MKLQETKTRLVNTVLVTGGATGTGFMTARMAMEQGFNVIIGTRNQEHYEDAVEQLKEAAVIRGKDVSSFEGRRVIPMVTDLTKQREVEEAFLPISDRLKETHVVHSAAAGMQNLSRPLMRKLVGFRRVGEEEFPDRFADLREWIGTEVDKSLTRNDGAVNSTAAIALVEGIRDIRSQANDKGIDLTPAWLIDYSSFPSTFFTHFYPSEGEHLGPSFYRGVAQTKHEFEQWLTDNAEALIAEGMYPVIISASLLTDTDVGVLFKALDRYMGRFFEEDRFNLEGFPKMEDLASAAVNEVLKRRPCRGAFSQWPGRLYVPRPGVISEEPPDREDLERLELPI